MNIWLSRLALGISALALVLLAGCKDQVPSDVNEWPVVPTSVAEAPQYVGETTLVSLMGRVTAQDSTGRNLTLMDGTGTLQVLLPEPLPPLDDAAVGIRGVVQRQAGAPVVRALEWTFDPTFTD